MAFNDPDSCRDERVRSHKEGSLKKGQDSTKCGGVDVSKLWLDGAVCGLDDRVRVSNTAEGVSELIAWFKARGIVRVGFEATGGHERKLLMALSALELEVVMFQPLQVLAFGRFKGRKAKNDESDARLIAAATAQVDAVRAACDPLLMDLAERFTVYERISEMAAQLKTFVQQLDGEDHRAEVQAQILSLVAVKMRLARRIIATIKAEPRLAQRYGLLTSIPGIGPVIAASLVVRMPELGSMDLGQAASMLGTAPYDRDSGSFKGRRFIGGGRERPRRMMYMAALTAIRHDPGFKAFAARLVSAGKARKVAIVAVMRKLIEAANLVLKRNQPWVTRPAN